MATKQSLYFPEQMLREIMTESVRLDRSISWTVQHAWRVAREELRKLPAAPPETGGGQEPIRPDARAAPSDPGGRGPSAQVLEFLKGKFESATH